MIHATKGIVLRSIPYGDTSIISSVYTELFGLQHYLVKGIRKTSRKSVSKSACFQPGAIVELVVYHNEQKHLQYVREVDWSYLYTGVFSEVVKNTVALFMVELLQHSLQQPESNAELFYFVERSLQELDKGSDGVTANLPLLFSLQLAVLLGFQLQGYYSATFHVLDLQEGQFVRERPTHPYFIEGNAASVTARLYQITSYDQLENMQLDRNQRRELLENYLQFYALHIHDFGTLRSLPVLKEVLQ